MPAAFCQNIISDVDFHKMSFTAYCFVTAKWKEKLIIEAVILNPKSDSAALFNCCNTL